MLVQYLVIQKTCGSYLPDLAVEGINHHKIIGAFIKNAHHLASVLIRDPFLAAPGL
jgi:hypothetical protein